MEDGQTALALTACQRCREQKVRCSHEQPECAKCARLGLPCTYPEPPDRRLIASRRMQARKRPAFDPSDIAEQTSTGERNDQRNVASGPIGVTTQQKRRRPEWVPTDAPPARPTVTSLCSPQPPGQLSELRKLLQDTYLTCAFNASLVIHLPSFEQIDSQGTVPKHTLLAIHAYSAHFITPVSSRDQRYHALTRDLGDLRALSERWALEAGKLALQEADEPTLYTIQTCQILSLYWFAKGDSKRNTMFSGIGYRAVRSTVVDSKDKLITGPCPSQNLVTAQPIDLDAEKLKRLFWASWITNVINSDHYTPGSAADTLVLTLPLPVSEEAFLRSTEEPASPATIAQSCNKHAHDGLSTGAQEPSIMAEIVKVIMIWARIRDHIDMRRSFPQREAWVNAFSLQTDISNWASQLHPDLAYSKRNLYRQLVVKQQPIYAMLHALHHQCYLVLNASLVPHFSGLILPRDMPREVVQMSAAVALRSARSLSELGAHLIALEWDPAQIAPFVGYCMYVAASVQMSVLPRNSEGGGAAWENMINCLKLLKLMKPYWAVLGQLWTRILRLYDAQVANTRTAPVTPTGELDAEQQEYLESPERDTGDLEEPLEDSVLHYSLRKLQKDVSTNGGSPSAQGLERAVSLGVNRSVADRMIQGDITIPVVVSTKPQQQQGVLETLASTFSPNLFPAQLANRQLGISAHCAEQQLHQDSLESLDNIIQSPLTSFIPLGMNGLDEHDWFQLDMENSAQVREALNDFF